MLLELFCEDEVVLDKIVMSKSIHPDLLKASLVARRACNDFAMDDIANGIKMALSKKASFLLQVDRMFKIELAFWDQTIGDSASGRLVDAIMRCFPNLEQVRTMAQAKALLAKLPDSKLATLCGMGLQALLSTVSELLDNIMMGMSPNWKKIAGSPVAEKLPASFARFCTTEQNLEGKAIQKEYGDVALTMKFEVLSLKCETSEAKPTCRVGPLPTACLVAHRGPGSVDQDLE